MDKPYNISFSGGRTSAYMTKLLLDNHADKYDFIVTFANTGLEHEKTLEFVDNCDKYFNFNTVWLEADTQEDGVGTKFKIVDFKTASRKAEPFEEVIDKYGIPNLSYLHCTRELKLAPMQTYLRSVGVDHRKIPVALGIRLDETRRVSEKAGIDKIEYPLIYEWPTTKGQVLHWWSQQAFDLGLEEFEGNCFGCFKKSHKKLFMQIRKDPSVFDFHRRMEELYRFHKMPDGDMRVFFRGNLDTVGLFKLHDELGDYMFSQMDFFETPEDENGGCTESCELYPME